MNAFEYNVLFPRQFYVYQIENDFALQPYKIEIKPLHSNYSSF